MGSFNVTLKNFQSIEDAELTFDTGINVIVGQSNSGKTAIIRAVNALLSNPSKAKRFINYGASSTSVAIDYEDNNVEWSRDKSSVTYAINDESYAKSGRTNLFELLPDNGFVQDESGNIMNIESEWDLPFPFDRSPSELFKLFENIFCVSDSAVILKAFKDEETQLVKQRGSYEDSLERVNAKIKALDEIESEVDIDKIQREVASFNEKGKKLFEMIEDLNVIENCQKLANFSIDEKLPPSEYSLPKLQMAEADCKFLIEVANRIKFYKSLPEPLIIGDNIDKYKQVIEDLKEIEHAIKLSEIDLSKECEIELDTLDKLREMNEDLKTLEKAKEISEIELPEDFVCTDVLQQYRDIVADYKVIYDSYKQCQALKTRYTEVETKLEELQASLSEFKVCPLCGHELA